MEGLVGKEPLSLSRGVGKGHAGDLEAWRSSVN